MIPTVANYLYSSDQGAWRTRLFVFLEGSPSNMVRIPKRIVIIPSRDRGKARWHPKLQELPSNAIVGASSDKISTMESRLTAHQHGGRQNAK